MLPQTALSGRNLAKARQQGSNDVLTNMIKPGGGNYDTYVLKLVDLAKKGGA